MSDPKHKLDLAPRQFTGRPGTVTPLRSVTPSQWHIHLDDADGTATPSPRGQEDAASATPDGGNDR